MESLKILFFLSFIYNFSYQSDIIKIYGSTITKIYHDGNVVQNNYQGNVISADEKNTLTIAGWIKPLTDDEYNALIAARRILAPGKGKGPKKPKKPKKNKGNSEDDSEDEEDYKVNKADWKNNRISKEVTINSIPYTLQSETVSQTELQPQVLALEYIEQEVSKPVFEIYDLTGKFILGLSYLTEGFSIEMGTQSKNVPLDAGWTDYWVYYYLSINFQTSSLSFYSMTAGKIINSVISISSPLSLTKGTLQVGKRTYDGWDYGCNCKVYNMKAANNYFSDNLVQVSDFRKNEPTLVGQFSFKSIPTAAIKSYPNDVTSPILVPSLTFGNIIAVTPSPQTDSWQNYIDKFIFAVRLRNSKFVSLSIPVTIGSEFTLSLKFKLVNMKLARFTFFKATDNFEGYFEKKPTGKYGLNFKFLTSSTNCELEERKWYHMFLIFSYFPDDKKTYAFRFEIFDLLNGGLYTGTIMQPTSLVSSITSSSLKNWDMVFGSEGFDGFIKNIRVFQGSGFSNLLNSGICPNGCLGCFSKVQTLRTIIKSADTECMFCKSGQVLDELTKTVPCASTCSVNARSKPVPKAASCEYCSAGDCSKEVCLNGVEEGEEMCDDGMNPPAVTGCLADCTDPKPGYECQINQALKDTCIEKCGDGILTPSEDCDLGSTSSPGCVNCKLTKGYFCVQKLCTICTELCDRCENSVRCSVCKQGYFLFSETGKCSQTCPPGYLQNADTGKCISCTISKCSECDSSQACLKCVTPNLLSQNQCISSCPQSTVSYEGKCVVCNANCLVCQPPPEKTCTNCVTKFYVHAGNCVSACPTIGFFTDETTQACRSCITDCKTCTSLDTCTVCLDGKVLVNSKTCASNCPAPQVAVAGICRTCDQAFGNSCSTCDAVSCKKCQTGYYLDQTKKCVSPCPTGQYGDDSTGQCNLCSTDCLSCTKTGCTACISTSLLNKATLTCTSTCPIGFKTDSTAKTCTVCTVPDCAECSTEINTCTNCAKNFYLVEDENKCVSTCQAKYYISSTVAPLKCSGCPSACASCQKSLLNNNLVCLSCITNQYLVGESCLSACPVSTYPDSNTCKNCAVENCATCVDASKTCQKCKSSFYLFIESSTVHYCQNICPIKYKTNLPQATCEKCQVTNCDDCTTSISTCDSCSSSFYYLSSTPTCVNACPTSSTPINKVCTPCEVGSCSDCSSDIKKCQTCLDSKVYNPTTNTCLASCPDGFYESGGICSLCIPDCKTCLKTSPTKCEECLKGSLLYNNICTSSCPSSTYIDTGSSLNCLPCSDYCQKCKDKTICFTCVGGYYLTGATSVSCTLNCGTTFYGSTTTGKCEKCVENCLKCTNGNSCKECITGYIFQSTLNKCVPTSCKEGFYVSDKGDCQSCPQNYCSECSISSCSKCLSNYFMQGSECKTSCIEGYTADINNICKGCKSSCLKCEYPSLNCLSCSSSTYLHGNQCVGSCPSGFYAEKGTCKACLVNCAECKNTISCISCKTTFLLMLYDSNNNFKCIDKCPSVDYFENKATFTCEKCQPNCQNCQSSTICTICDSGYFLNSALFTCGTDCPAGTYQDTQTRECKSCGIKFCKTCIGMTDASGNTYPVCKSCQGGNYLNQDLNACESSCSVSYTNVDSFCKKCADPYCLSCTLGVNTCNFCQSPYLVIDSKTCIAKCPLEGYYPENKSGATCQKCIQNCKTCAGGSVCSECNPSFLKYYDYKTLKNSCLVKCPEGTYQSKDSLECLDCPKECSKCSEPTLCTECVDPHLQLNEESTKRCVLNCPVKYRRNQKQCEQCKVDHCNTCSGEAQFCDVCEAGLALTLDKSQCLSECPEGSLKIINERSENVCRKCADGCNKCTEENNPNACSGCFEGFYLLDNKCLKDCPNNYFKSPTDRLCLHCVPDCLNCAKENSCEICNLNFFLDTLTGVCKSSQDISIGFYGNQEKKVIMPCDVQNCEKCQNQGACDQCLQNFFYNSETFLCLEKCPVGFVENNDKRTCEKCLVNGCDRCLTVDICQKCSQGMYLYSKENLCKEGCDVTKGYIKVEEDNICLKCPVNCTTCLYEQLPDPRLSNVIACKTCEPGNLLLLGKCVNKLDCPPGFYKINGNECKPCGHKCVNCNELGNCMKCERSFYLLNTTCVKTCDSQKNEFAFDKNQTCITCPQGHFFSNTTEKCEKCSRNCLYCTDELSCNVCVTQDFTLTTEGNKKYCNFTSICPATQRFMNGECAPCDSDKHFTKDCKDVCGDGYLENKENIDGICDDGNTVSGDGCSKDCKIEPNFKCIRVNTTSPDDCYDLRPANFSFLYDEKDPTKLIVKSSRPIKFASFEESFAQFFDVALPKLNSSQYQVKVVRQTSDEVEFQIVYNVSAKNQIMKIELKNGSLGVKDKYGIEIIPPDMKGYKQEVPLNSYLNLSEDDKKSVENMKTATKVVSSAVAISMLPLQLLQALGVVWVLLDAMQVANFFLFINVDYPPNAADFLKVLNSANLDFIPNPFKSSDNDKRTLIGEPIIDQKAPNRFDKLDYTSNFLKNAGGLFILVLLILILFTIQKILYKKYIEDNKTGIKGYFINLLIQVRAAFEYGLLIRAHQMVLLELSLATLLQTINFSSASSINIISYFLAILYLVYLTLSFPLMYWKVNKKKNKLEEDYYNKKFGTLTADLKLNFVSTRNFNIIIMLKKFLFVIILVALHDQPVLEIILVSSLSIISLIYVICVKPYTKKQINFLAIVTDLLFTVAMSVVCILIYYEKYVETDIIDQSIVEKKILLGWIFDAIIAVILLGYLIYFFSEQIENIKAVIKVLKEIKQKGNRIASKWFRSKTGGIELTDKTLETQNTSTQELESQKNSFVKNSKETFLNPEDYFSQRTISTLEDMNDLSEEELYKRRLNENKESVTRYFSNVKKV